MNQINADEITTMTVCLTPEVTHVLKRAASEASRTLEEYISMILVIHASDVSKIQRMMDNFDEAFSENETEGDKLV